MRVGREEETQFVTVFISRSNTDQSGTGVYRSLVANGGKVGVVMSLFKWANRKKWEPGRKGLVRRSNILATIGKTLEWISAIEGLPTKLYPSHSMRAGGGAHSYLSKVPIGLIRRFGRWVSQCFWRTCAMITLIYGK